MPVRPHDDLRPPADLLASAEAGDADAQNALGRFYAQNTAEAGHLDRAHDWFVRAADQGSGAAMHNLGVLALRDEQESRAERWFARAIEQGWLNSAVALAGICERTERNADAVQLYATAARKGHPEAEAALGRMFLDTDTPQGYELARYWSERAAAQGVASAHAHLGTIYHEGLGVPRDPQRAAQHFLKGAQGGHAGSQTMIGAALHLGIGIAADRREAYFWLRQGAARGSVLAEAYMQRVEAELSRDEKATVEARLQRLTD